MKVAVGLSGGIDSFVTALVLKNNGCEVIGVYLKLADCGEEFPADILKIGEFLDIPIFVKDGRTLFSGEVEEAFVEAYASGTTPSPCVTCNGKVKWILLAEAAREIGAEHIATGHYVNIEKIDGLYYVGCGTDPTKDQSYYLWQLEQEMLRMAITPLGSLAKQEVRRMAAAAGADFLCRKRESMGLCFLKGMDYRAYLAKYHPGKGDKEGEILSVPGEILGKHKGIRNFTVGQKIRLSGMKSPLYVHSTDAARNAVVVGDKSGLWRRDFKLGRIRFTAPCDRFRDLTVRIRGVGENPSGFVELQEEGEGLRVITREPVWGCAPGQPAVFYYDRYVVGGGILEC